MKLPDTVYMEHIRKDEVQLQYLWDEHKEDKQAIFNQLKELGESVTLAIKDMIDEVR